MKPDEEKDLFGQFKAQRAAKASPYGTDLDDAALAKAQSNANDFSLLAGVGRTVAGLGATLTRQRPDFGAQDALERDGQRGVANILQRRSADDQNFMRVAKEREMQRQMMADAEAQKHRASMRDPNSPVVQALRGVYSKIDPSIQDNPAYQGLSLEEWGHLAPALKELGEFQKGQKPKQVDPDYVPVPTDKGLFGLDKHTGKLMRLQGDDGSPLAAPAKEITPDYVPVATEGGYVGFNKRTGKPIPLQGSGGEPLRPPAKGESTGATEKQWTDLENSVDTSRGRGSLLKENQQRLNNIDRLEALIKLPNGGIQNLNPQQVREAATSLANVLSSGGSNAVSQIEELVPHTYASNWANLRQKVLDEPQGADAQAFLQNMLETAARERAVISKQIREAQLRGLPKRIHLRGQNPDKFNSILQAAGIDPAYVDAHGLEIKEGPDYRLVKHRDGRLFRQYADGSGEAVE